MATALLRRSSNSMLGGVCAGIAELYGINVATVRVALVILSVIGLPVILVYVLAWMVLPAPQALTPPPESNAATVAWQADQVVLTYRVPIVPSVLSWQQVGVGLAILVALAMGPALGGHLIGALLTTSGAASDPGQEFILAFLARIFDPIAWQQTTMLYQQFVGLLVAGVLALMVVPFRQRLVCTTTELVVKRPLLGERRIPLVEITSVVQRDDALFIEIGAEKSLLALKLGLDVSDFVAQLNRGRQRALAHQQDLAQTAEQRQQLESMISQQD